MFNKNEKVRIFQDAFQDKQRGAGMVHSSSVSGLHATELYIQKGLKWLVLHYVCFFMIKTTLQMDIKPSEKSIYTELRELRGRELVMRFKRKEWLKNHFSCCLC